MQPDKNARYAFILTADARRYVNKTMNCPHCNNRLPIMDIKRNFICQGCKISLEILNNFMAVIVAAIIWLTISSFVYFSPWFKGDVFLAMFIDIIIAPAVGAFFYYQLIKVRIKR